MKIEVEINPEEHHLMKKIGVKEAYKLLEEVYGVLWCESSYDPTNEQLQKFCKPLAGKMMRANDILEFKT